MEKTPIKQDFNLSGMAALEAAQKDATNKFAKYNYVSLTSINSVINPFLVANKLMVTSSLREEKINNTYISYMLETYLLSQDKQILISNYCPVIISVAAKNIMQELGAAITYARKYNLKAMFNLSEDDDDAASINKPNTIKDFKSGDKNQTEATKKKLLEEFNKFNITEKQIINAFGKDYTKDMSKLRTVFAQLREGSADTHHFFEVEKNGKDDQQPTN